jgi:hypothetical protein
LALPAIQEGIGIRNRFVEERIYVLLRIMRFAVCPPYSACSACPGRLTLLVIENGPSSQISHLRSAILKPGPEKCFNIVWKKSISIVFIIPVLGILDYVAGISWWFLVRKASLSFFVPLSILVGRPSAAIRTLFSKVYFVQRITKRIEFVKYRSAVIV